MLNWIKMNLSKEDWDLAYKYAEIEMENAKGNPIFQTESALNDHVVGHIGQIKFDEWLTSQNIPHLYINDLNGIGDKGRDFVIGNHTIDVKTAESDRPIEMIGDNYMMFIAKQQYDKHPNVNSFFHIQVDPERVELYLIGSIDYSCVRIFPVKQYRNNINPAYNIPLICLIPPLTWLNEIKDLLRIGF